VAHERKILHCKSERKQTNKQKQKQTQKEKEKRKKKREETEGGNFDISFETSIVISC